VHRTIPTLFRTAVDDAADTPWLFADGLTLTYGEAQERIERAASWFRAEGVGAGDIVMVTARNLPGYLLAWLALMEVGAVQLPVNPRSTRAELTGFVSQARPRLVVTDPTLRADVAAAVAESGGGAGPDGTPIRLVDVDELSTAEPDGLGPTPRQPEDVAVMIPTSGTTGRSKLVMQTHLAYVMAGEGFPFWTGLTADDRLMTSLPLFHINAPAYSTLGSVAARAGLVLLPGFSASRFLDDARRFGATEFNSIGAMLEILMRQPERDDDADTPLRLCYTGPSPSKERHLEIERRLGLELVCGYGMSESTYGLFWARGARPYGSLGSARQHPTLGHVNDVRVVDVGPDGVGELEMRNPAVMRGYFEMPEETAAVLVDGWLRTGDLVTDDGDGTYTFVGRRKEVIRRRGENLSPTEVEAALEAHPDVALAAVIGVPSELSEQDVKAFLVPTAAGADLDLAGVDALARERLARFKVPRYYEVVAELPQTPTGRLAKHKLPTGRTAAELDMEQDGARG
jgi:carnitine-CoA ligase